MKLRLVATMLGAASLLGGCMSMDGGGEAKAPEPMKPIDTARFYTGRWYEIARTPMNITKGCVAGTTDYSQSPDGRFMDRDACRQDTPEGREKVFAGPIDVLNPGQNTKIRINYKVAGGLFTFKVTYWMLDHGADYRWFIVTTPDFKNLSYFTRDPRPPQAEVDAFTAKAKTMGFTGALEYPAQFPSGEGQPGS